MRPNNAVDAGHCCVCVGMVPGACYHNGPPRLCSMHSPGPGVAEAVELSDPIARGAAMGEAFAGLGRNVQVACAPTMHLKGECAGCSVPPGAYMTFAGCSVPPGAYMTFVGAPAPDQIPEGPDPRTLTGQTVESAHPGDAASASDPTGPSGQSSEGGDHQGATPAGPSSPPPSDSLDPAAQMAEAFVRAVERLGNPEISREAIKTVLAADLRTALESYR